MLKTKEKMKLAALKSGLFYVAYVAGIIVCFQWLSQTVGSSARHTRDIHATSNRQFCCDVILWTTKDFALLAWPVIFSAHRVVGVRSAFSGHDSGATERF